jgi:hypothetical protein
LSATWVRVNTRDGMDEMQWQAMRRSVMRCARTPEVEPMPSLLMVTCSVTRGVVRGAWCMVRGAWCVVTTTIPNSILHHSSSLVVRSASLSRRWKMRSMACQQVMMACYLVQFRHWWWPSSLAILRSPSLSTARHVLVKQHRRLRSQTSTQIPRQSVPGHFPSYRSSSWSSTRACTSMYRHVGQHAFQGFAEPHHG